MTNTPFTAIMDLATRAEDLADLEGRVLCMEDPFFGPTHETAERGALPAFIKAAARENPQIEICLMTIAPAGYADRGPWPRNVWLGLRATTAAEVESGLAVLKAVPHDGRRWLSCTPRDAVTVPKGAVDWVFCNGDSMEMPLFPDAVVQLRNSCKANRVPFWFQGWDGWVEVLRSGEPLLTEGDAVVQLDGKIAGRIKEVRRGDDGTIKDLQVERNGPRRRALGREAYMRRVGERVGTEADRLIGKFASRELPR